MNDGAMVILPVLGGVLIVIIAILLVWKMASVYWENLEVARLEKELHSPEIIMSNPIYVAPKKRMDRRPMSEYEMVPESERMPDIVAV